MKEELDAKNMENSSMTEMVKYLNNLTAVSETQVADLLIQSNRELFYDRSEVETSVQDLKSQVIVNIRVTLEQAKNKEKTEIGRASCRERVFRAV